MTVICETEGWRVVQFQMHGRPYQIQRYVASQKRWVWDCSMVYLFSEAEHGDGNAVCVIACDEDQALQQARRFSSGFTPSRAADGYDWTTIGREPIVVVASSYYRPGLSFQLLDNFSNLSAIQAQEIRRVLNEQHPEEKHE